MAVIDIDEAWLDSNVPYEITPTVLFAAQCIAFNPIFWNLAAQLEFRLGAISRVAGKYGGCYLLAITIFVLGLYRDYVFHSALETQPVAPALAKPAVHYLGIALMGVGNILTLSSMWVLGVTGTYLGDYFGILMEERVTGFPFNFVENPMYVGSYLSFMGYSLYSAKAIGLVLASLVWGMYSLALKFEGPFTARIYNERDALRKANASKKKAE